MMMLDMPVQLELLLVRLVASVTRVHYRSFVVFFDEMFAPVVVANKNLWAMRTLVAEPATCMDALFMVSLLRQRRIRLLTVGAREYTLSVRLPVLPQRRYRYIPSPALLAAVVPVMAAHVVVKILERNVNDRANDTCEVLSVFQAEGEYDIFDVFVDDFVVYVYEVFLEVVQVLERDLADGAVQVCDVKFDGVVAKFVVYHGVELVFL